LLNNFGYLQGKRKDVKKAVRKKDGNSSHLLNRKKSQSAKSGQRGFRNSKAHQ
jgi:hypothetical protein